MTEHVHEWYLSAVATLAVCQHCDATIATREIERRLNATERLSAKQARELSSYMEDIADAIDFEITENQLLDYAETLEGKGVPTFERPR